MLELSGGGYAEKRLIPQNSEWEEVNNIIWNDSVKNLAIKAIGHYIPNIRKTNAYSENYFTYRNRHLKNINILHSYNRVCDVNIPWIASFECTMPTYAGGKKTLNKEQVKKHIELILQDNCKKILPLSQWAYDCEMRFLNQNHEEDIVEIIRKKMIVLYPPQQLLIKKIEEYHLNEIRFMFVGRQFFRKGGYLCYQVFKNIRRRYPVKLILIGKMGEENNLAYDISEEEKQKMFSFFEDEREWLTYYPALENEEVLEQMKKCHVGLLPTYGDTFGFSVLEMQAAGMPVITTNRQALSEINDDKVGWIIDTRQFSEGLSDYYGEYTKMQIKRVGDYINEQLEKIVFDICDHPEQIVEKSKRALDRIRIYHSPTDYEAKIKNFYLDNIVMK